MSLCPDQFYAQNVLQCVQSFVDVFNECGEVGAARRILDGETEFRGGIVGQQPERFTEDKLIHPLCEVLDYRGIVAQPADLVPDERRVPDMLIEEFDDECICIGEAKRFGFLEETVDSNGQNIAEREMKTYLQENALAKYKRDLDVTYLVGIATDGVVWSALGKQLETEETANLAQESLDQTFGQAFLAKQFPREVAQKWRVTERKRLVKNFIPLFEASALKESLLQEFPE